MFVGDVRPLVQTEQQRILGQMGLLIGIEFYLTGSRRFGTNTEASDWDFFTDTLGDRQKRILADMGFVEQPKHVMKAEYADNYCLAVWRHPCGIDIQERENAALFETVCQYLDRFPSLLPSDKRIRRGTWWNQLLRFASFVVQNYEKNI